MITFLPYFSICKGSPNSPFRFCISLNWHSANKMILPYAKSMKKNLLLVGSLKVFEFLRVVRKGGRTWGGSSVISK